jgi:succinate-semialdehyde dehydrogenase/glutarate-semialdehyde dehydrogenase
LGPLALSSDPNRIAGLIDKAEAAGTRVIRSTVRVPANGHFSPPAICINPPLEDPIVSDEIFGPVISIRGYQDLDQVITATGETRYGLGGYIVGEPIRAKILADVLDVGIIGINTATPNTPQVPFGGLKHSGIGWEGGEVGLDAFVTHQTVATSAR